MTITITPQVIKFYSWGLLISALGVYRQREAILNAIGGKQKNKTPNNKQPSTPTPPPTPKRSKPQSRIRKRE